MVPCTPPWSRPRSFTWPSLTTGFSLGKNKSPLSQFHDFLTSRNCECISRHEYFRGAFFFCNFFSVPSGRRRQQRLSATPDCARTLAGWRTGSTGWGEGLHSSRRLLSSHSPSLSLPLSLSRGSSFLITSPISSVWAHQRQSGFEDPLSASSLPL